MKKKIRDNKGISLVEILVSLAIVSLMIVPIAMLVNTAIKMNKKSEVRQQAVLLGQQVLEEINILEEVNSDSISLLENKEFEGENSNSKDESIYRLEEYLFGNNKYNIEISLSRNKDIEYSENPQSDTTNIQNTFSLISDSEESIQINKNGRNELLNLDTDDPRLDIEITEGCLSITDGNYETITYDMTNNQVMFDFTNQYKRNSGITLNIKNNTGDNIEFYIKKSFECEERIYVEKDSDIEIHNIRDNEELSDSAIGNLYNIFVEVSKNEDTLFEGNGSKNIKYEENG